MTLSKFAVKVMRRGPLKSECSVSWGVCFSSVCGSKLASMKGLREFIDWLREVLKGHAEPKPVPIPVRVRDRR